MDTSSITGSEKDTGLRKTIGLTTGISVIVGNIIGSGIFVSPKTVLNATKSVGLCLVVWVLSGVISLIAALSYAELGTFFIESGAELSYILRGYSSVHPELGRLFAFMFVWSVFLISGPASIAAISLACADYILGPIIHCELSPTLIKLTALAVLLLCAIITAYSVNITNRILEVFTLAKIGALVVIIIGGIVRLSRGYTQNFDNSFVGTTGNVLQIASGFYGGLWAYSGWSNLNTLSEEVINPKRNIPLSIVFSVILCIIIYTAVNISYFTVMTKDELLGSIGVAITWGDAVLPSYLSWFIPTSVAMSTFSSTLCNFYGYSRIYYVAGREGLLPKIIGMIHPEHHTPVPAIVSLFLFSALFLIPSNISELIEISGFFTWISIGLSVVALLITRYTMREKPRVLKIPIVIHVIVILFAIYLLIAPLIDSVKIEYLGTIGLYASSLIFYIPLVYFKLKIPYLEYCSMLVQNLFEVKLYNKNN